MEYRGRNDIVWHDRKRHLGLPLSFTVYYLSDDRLFWETGFFTTKIESLLLYRVRDITLQRTLWQKLFKVGTVKIISSDKTDPVLEIKNIKNSAQIAELLYTSVEEMKLNRRMRVSELVTDIDEDELLDDMDSEC